MIVIRAMTSDPLRDNGKDWVIWQDPDTQAITELAIVRRVADAPIKWQPAAESISPALRKDIIAAVAARTFGEKPEETP